MTRGKRIQLVFVGNKVDALIKVWNQVTFKCFGCT